jgi:hypothetical protein
MEYIEEFKNAIMDRINDLALAQQEMTTAYAMIVAGVNPAKVYAFCKTGVFHSKFAPPEWHAAVKYFNSELK